MKTTLLLNALLLISYTTAFSQYEQCFTVDDNSLLAIDLNTKANYNGTCQQFYDNQQIAWQMIIADGTPIEMKNWHKNGQLSDSTIYVNGFNLFKRFTFDRKGRIISEEVLVMKSIAQSNDKKVLRMAAKKKYSNSTVYEDCLSYKSICYSKNNTPQYEYQTMYDQSKTLLIQYHENGNVSDSTLFAHKSIGEARYIPVKEGTTQYDLAGNKSAEKIFENNTIVKETMLENEKTTLESDDKNRILTKDALLISENGEKVKVYVKPADQGNTEIFN